ncbi:lengsin-like [Haliotis asinina]|uniref:lengsin-like n=1 Tax=Haliotis asinina TaxID=109174 RepID=UPI0035321BCB
MSKLEEVAQEIAKFDYVRFSICDLNGMSRGKVVASRHSKKYLENGLEMSQDILLHGPRTLSLDYMKYDLGSALIVPDLDTLRAIPWAPEGVKVAELLCETRWKTDNTPHGACPRYAARKQLQRLADLGLTFYSSHEIEFQLLDGKTLKTVFDGHDSYSQKVFNKHAKIIFHFDKNYQESKVDVEKHHVELSPGVFEFVTKPNYGLKSMDMVFNLKEGLLEMADLKGLKATFMSHFTSKEQIALSTDLNFSLWNISGGNVFYDANAPDKLSTVAKQWIAGILKHSKALSAFASPTVNCYRNFDCQLKPTVPSWGIEDREACLRIKNEGPLKTYIENRLPTGKCNVYLVAASTIAAGLDGVIKKMECPPPGTSEHDESLPRSLAEALDELEQDEELCDALGKELVAWFVKYKRDTEIAKYEDVKADEERFLFEKEDYL